mmetsp:Transcript_6849/g.20162  ORF Transcript_6849/g.20162 Transcript_6849/m.20162 type:complete len:224 (-) Transcript_6849:345-1016(-)
MGGGAQGAAQRPPPDPLRARAGELPEARREELRRTCCAARPPPPPLRALQHELQELPHHALRAEALPPGRGDHDGGPAWGLPVHPEHRDGQPRASRPVPAHREERVLLRPVQHVPGREGEGQRGARVHRRHRVPVPGARHRPEGLQRPASEVSREQGRRAHAGGRGETREEAPAGRVREDRAPQAGPGEGHGGTGLVQDGIGRSWGQQALQGAHGARVPSLET